MLAVGLRHALPEPRASEVAEKVADRRKRLSHRFATPTRMVGQAICLSIYCCRDFFSNLVSVGVARAV